MKDHLRAAKLPLSALVAIVIGALVVGLKGPASAGSSSCDTASDGDFNVTACIEPSSISPGGMLTFSGTIEGICSDQYHYLTVVTAETTFDAGEGTAAELGGAVAGGYGEGQHASSTQDFSIDLDTSQSWASGLAPGAYTVSSAFTLARMFCYPSGQDNDTITLTMSLLVDGGAPTEEPTPDCPTDLSEDDDMDGLSDDDENIIGSDPCEADTDGDGLLDGWEVNGFDLDGDGEFDAEVDEVFGPYDSMNGAPFVLQKDVYVEVDWQDCSALAPTQFPDPFDYSCPEPLMVLDMFRRIYWSETGIVLPPADPMHHKPNVAALQLVQQEFSVQGIRLNILMDEAYPHTPNCDQLPIAKEEERFGTAAQRQDEDVIAAKQLAFRYLFSGHSNLYDDGSGECSTEVPILGDSFFFFWHFLLGGFGAVPLPDWDWTTFGQAAQGGDEILVNLGPIWICPTDKLGFDGQFPVGIGNFTLCMRGECVEVGTVCLGKPGIFPARIEGQGSTVFQQPLALYLETGEELATEQLWSRSVMHLLGHALGLNHTHAANNPTEIGALRPEPYGSWEDLKYAPGPGGPIHQESFPPFDQLQGAVLAGADSPECPVAEPDVDTDGLADVCDPDADGDGFDNLLETMVGSNPLDAQNTPEILGRDSTCTDGVDNDGDGRADAADEGCIDTDGDSAPDYLDGCPQLADPGWPDTDIDGMGNACDPNPVPGDTDCNGVVTIHDVLAVMKAIGGLDEAACGERADVDCDGDLAGADVLSALRFLAGGIALLEDGCG